MSDTLRDMEIWHERARPEPTTANMNVQLGCHFEEICEMMECLTSSDKAGDGVLNDAYNTLLYLAEKLKSGGIRVAVSVAERNEFLDSLADQVVTAAGVAHCAGMDMTEACKRVNASNWSKFVDGQPVFNESGKIAKGPDYAPPDLRGLV